MTSGVSPGVTITSEPEPEKQQTVETFQPSVNKTASSPSVVQKDWQVRTLEDRNLLREKTE